jgi:hypothetical protein
MFNHCEEPKRMQMRGDLTIALCRKVARTFTVTALIIIVGFCVAPVSAQQINGVPVSSARTRPSVRKVPPSAGSFGAMVIPPRDSAKPKYARLSIQLGRSLQPMASGDGL